MFTEEEAGLIRQMIGFRNRLVHGYERIDDERFYEIISNHLRDFDRFKNAVESLVGAEGSP